MFGIEREIADVAPLPLGEARLWEAGALTAERRANPVTQAETIHQPIVPGETAWSVQWNEYAFPRTKPGRSYRVFLRLRVEGDARSGPLCEFGWWDGRGRRFLLQRAIDALELRLAE